MRFKSTISRLAVIMMVLAVAIAGGAGSAAALSSASITAADDGTGASTTHTLSASDDTDSGDIDEITIDYEATNVEGLEAADANVTWGGADQSVADVVVEDETTATVVLDSAYTLDGSASETVDVELAGVTNPHNAGNYSVDMTLRDTSNSTELGPASTTLSISVGDTPSVTGNSDLSENASVVDYNASDDQTETVEVEAHTDNLELTLADPADENVTYATFDSGHESFEVVSESTDSSPGTYQWTLNHSDLRTVDMSINEVADVEVHVANTAADTPDNEFAFSIENSDEISQLHVESEDDSVAELTEEDGLLGIERFADSHATVDESRDMADNTSTVYVSMADSNITDEFDAAVGDDTEAGDALPLLMASSVDGELVYVYADEPGETLAGDEAAADDLYAVYHSDDGMMEINIPEDRYEDGDRADLALAGNDRPDAGDLRADLDFGVLNSISFAWGLSIPFAVVGAALLPAVGRRW